MCLCAFTSHNDKLTLLLLETSHLWWKRRSVVWTIRIICSIISGKYLKYCRVHVFKLHFKSKECPRNHILSFLCDKDLMPSGQDLIHYYLSVFMKCHEASYGIWWHNNKFRYCHMNCLMSILLLMYITIHIEKTWLVQNDALYVVY